jgi:hypothetical protein
MKPTRSLNESPIWIRITFLVLAFAGAIYGAWLFEGLDDETRRLLLVLLSAGALAAFITEFLQNATGPATLKALVSMGTLAATCTAYFEAFPGSGVTLHDWVLMSIVILCGLGLGFVIALYEYWFTRLFPQKN